MNGNPPSLADVGQRHGEIGLDRSELLADLGMHGELHSDLNPQLGRVHAVADDANPSSAVTLNGLIFGLSIIVLSYSESTSSLGRGIFEPRPVLRSLARVHAATAEPRAGSPMTMRSASLSF